jgi:amino acid adenylation domain-containing protein
VLADDERTWLLATAAVETVVAGGASTIHQRVADQVRRTPDAIALSCGDRRMSYGELDARSNQLAHRLRQLGAGPETRIGVHLDPSIEMVVAVLGVLKAGAAYVPIHGQWPAERAGFVLADAGAAALVTSAERAAERPGDPLPTVVLDPAWTSLASLPATPPPETALDTALSGSLAYVIYTSGSTGRPKGVLIPHDRVLRLFDATRELELGPADVWTLFHSVAFDVSVFEMWGALMHGGRLVIVPHLVGRSPEQFRRLLTVEAVTVLSQTPLAFRQLIPADAADPGPLSLRLVLFAGEALDRKTLRPWFERRGDARPRLVNLYGITETTVHNTICWLTARDVDGPDQASVGRPMRDLRMLVLDRHGELAPIGVPGEIHVGGAGLARGYLGRPDLTAERFVPDAFSGVPGARLYRSGDAGRIRADGAIECLGRLDRQIKLRGHRIELEDIERTLRGLPAVADAAVVVEGDDPATQVLVAYLVARDGHAPAPTRLRADAGRWLPAYMMPARMHLVDALPRTGNGKLDRAALSALTRRAAPAPVEVPENATDDLLDRIGALSPAQQEQLLARLGRAVARPADEPIPVAVGPGPYPVSFAQQQLWFLDRLVPGSPLYNMPVALRLDGALDRAALARSLAEVVRRHEVLRSAVIDRGAGPHQAVSPDAALHLDVVELAPGSDLDREVARRAAEEAARPFDLSRPPLVRASLLVAGPARHVLLFTMHHIASDGWSVDVLIREVAALYRAFRAGEPSPLAPLSIQYRDHAAWQRAAQDRPAQREKLEYWRRQLDGAPRALALPTDHPRPAVPTYRGAQVPARVDGDVLARLTGVAVRARATPFMALLAGFAALLARHARQAEVIIGTPVANRPRRETEALIGLFVNALAMRIDLAGDPTFDELLGRVRETALAGFAHQDVSFEQVVDAVQPERDLSRAPLFQAMLVLQTATTEMPRLDGLAVTSLPTTTATSKFDLLLSLGAEPGAAGLTGSWEFAADLFDASTIERLAVGLDLLLDAASRAPDTRLSRLPVVDLGQRAPHGDVDRARLPSAEPATPTAPADALEVLLAAIWLDVLQMGAVGTDDDFFALGGRSLLVTQLMHRVDELFRVEIPVQSMFEARTIRAQAELLSRLGGGRERMIHVAAVIQQAMSEVDEEP